jgi:hypothetical protein
MKKGVKSKIVTWSIIFLIIFGSILIINKNNNPETSEEIAKCIGRNSVLYTQLGCHACEKQEEAFGEKYQYINVVDCFYEKNKCAGIIATPTWVIKGEQYKGLQTIQRIKDLTSCNEK